MPAPFVFEGKLEFDHTEDGGMARWAELSDERRLFVRVHSYIDGVPHRHLHPEVEELDGQRVRITIEVLP